MTIEEPKRLRWYALRCETKSAVAKVEKAIKQMGITQLIPRAFRMEKRGKWMVAVDDGYLFPPFIFVAMRAPGHWKTRNSALWGQLADLPGVAEIMGNVARDGDRTPIAIPYDEMRKIRTKDRAGERRRVEVRYKEGQRVRVTAGPFTGFEGVFDQPEKERVKILLNIFGRSTPVVVAEDEVRAA